VNYCHVDAVVGFFSAFSGDMVGRRAGDPGGPPEIRKSENRKIPKNFRRRENPARALTGAKNFLVFLKVDSNDDFQNGRKIF
jgi:hypothetical protein